MGQEIRVRNDAADRQPSPNIRLGADGVYRWVYAFDMRRNPTLLFTVWRVLGIAFGAAFALMLLIDAVGGDLSPESFLSLLKGFGILLAVFLVIGWIAYRIVAHAYGGRYLVLFEMDETGVTHRQMPGQFETAQAMAWLSAMTASDVGGVGRGLAAAGKSESRVRFSELRGVRVLRRRDTVKLNERLERSQVYALPEDFDFVVDYILARTPDAARVRR